MLQTKDHCLNVRSLHFVHHGVGGLARAHHAFRGKDNLVVGRLDIFSRKVAPVMELDSLADRERVSKAVFGNRPLIFRHIADDFGIVLRIKAEQGAVVWRDGVKHCKGRFPMTVIGWGRAPHGKDQLATRSGILTLGRENDGRENNRCCRNRNEDFCERSFHGSSFSRVIPFGALCLNCRPSLAPRATQLTFCCQWILRVVFEANSYGRRAPSAIKYHDLPAVPSLIRIRSGAIPPDLSMSISLSLINR